MTIRHRQIMLVTWSEIIARKFKFVNGSNMSTLGRQFAEEKVGKTCLVINWLSIVAPSNLIPLKQEILLSVILKRKEPFTFEPRTISLNLPRSAFHRNFKV